MHTVFWMENLKRRDHSENLDNIRTVNRVGNCELDSSGSGLGPVVSRCEHGNEPSDSVKDGKFLY